MSETIDAPKTNKFAPKWDWELAFALFVGGMSFNDILKTPNFQGMSKKMLQNRAAREEWIRQRKEYSETLGQSLAKPLVERLAEAADIHQEFMRVRLERERKVLDNFVITNNVKDQRDRLENLRLLDDMSRKLTGLDDRKPVDNRQFNFNLTVHLASGAQPRQKNVKAGISGAGNAILEGVVTASKVLKAPALIEAASILRAKEAGELKEFAKSEPTTDLEVPDIDRSHLKPVPSLKVVDEPLVDESVNEESPDQSEDQPGLNTTET
jgi:hypothetical protein